MNNFVKITDLPVAESADGMNLVGHQNGEAKQIPANKVGVQADWNETDETSPAFILNKPTTGGCVKVLWTGYANNTSVQFIVPEECLNQINIYNSKRILLTFLLEFANQFGSDNSYPTYGGDKTALVSVYIETNYDAGVNNYYYSTIYSNESVEYGGNVITIGCKLVPDERVATGFVDISGYLPTGFYLASISAIIKEVVK